MIRIVIFLLACLLAISCTIEKKPVAAKDKEPEILYILPDGTMEFKGRIMNKEDVVIYEDGRGGEGGEGDPQERGDRLLQARRRGRRDGLEVHEPLPGLPHQVDRRHPLQEEVLLGPGEAPEPSLAGREHGR